MSNQTCPNGHPANSNGNCFNPGCVYRNDNRNKPVLVAGDLDG